MKVLVIRFSSIGDIILTTPVVRNLKTSGDLLEVHFATKSQYEFIVKENPYLDKIHLLDESGIWNLIKRLKSEHFDVIIDLHHNARTFIIKRALGVKSFAYKKLNIEKWLLTSFKINKLPNRHIVDRYLDTVKNLNISNDQLGLDYFIPEKDEVELEWLPEGFQNGFAAVIIGGKYSTKKLPTSRLIELCDRINKPVVLIGSKDETKAGTEIEQFFKPYDQPTEFDRGLEELGKKTIVYNGCGKFNFNQSASLVKQANWVFSHDTGMMHVAAAFKKKIYSIWGSTIPEFGMYPYRTKFTIFENKKLSCRPCSKIGFDKCPKGHFKCMNDLKFDFYIPD